MWAFAPVQDRRAAPAIAAALRELSACDEIEVVIVARGGGSLADLYAFCDEALCRTVALLRVPVISSVGHHTDRTLIDDVAAVCCSTPTHAAEVAVPFDLAAARTRLATDARRLRDHGHRALVVRARTLATLSRAPVPAAGPPAPAPAPAHPKELRAGSRRQLKHSDAAVEAAARALERVGVRGAGSDAARSAQ